MSLDRIAGIVHLAAADAGLASTRDKEPARLSDTARSRVSLAQKAKPVQVPHLPLVTRAAGTSPSSDGTLLPPEGSGQPPSPVIVQSPGPGPGPGPQPYPGPTPGPMPQPTPGPIPSPYQAPGPLGPMPCPKKPEKGPITWVPCHPGFRQPSSGPSSSSQDSGGMQQIISACAHTNGHECCLQVAAIVATVAQTAETAITAITAIAVKR